MFTDFGVAMPFLGVYPKDTTEPTETALSTRISIKMLNS